jgi:bifunctional UDP-N-acetylglucosamine pyrophosphorylase/glucosamine-1-phosphate N-acetyltransferase
MQAVILAAGKGTRLKPLTDQKPKALVEIAGTPMLELLLKELEKAGVKETVIVTGYLGEQIEHYFGNRLKKMKLSYAPQKMQLGTAHALLQAKKKITSDFLMGHCDVIAPASMWKRLAKTKKFEAVMALRKEEEPEKFGVVLTENELVAEIVEKPEKPKTDLVNAGCYKFSKKIFAELEKTKINPQRNEFELTDTLRGLAAKKKVGFLLAEEKIWDISSIEDLKDAEEHL